MKTSTLGILPSELLHYIDMYLLDGKIDISMISAKQFYSLGNLYNFYIACYHSPFNVFENSNLIQYFTENNCYCNIKFKIETGQIFWLRIYINWKYLLPILTIPIINVMHLQTLLLMYYYSCKFFILESVLIPVCYPECNIIEKISRLLINFINTNNAVYNINDELDNMLSNYTNYNINIFRIIFQFGYIQLNDNSCKCNALLDVICTNKIGLDQYCREFFGLSGFHLLLLIEVLNPHFTCKHDAFTFESSCYDQISVFNAIIVYANKNNTWSKLIHVLFDVLQLETIYIIQTIHKIFEKEYNEAKIEELIENPQETLRKIMLNNL